MNPAFRITLEFAANTGAANSSMKQEIVLDGFAVAESRGVLLSATAADACKKFWETAVLMGILDPP